MEIILVLFNEIRDQFGIIVIKCTTTIPIV